MYNINNRETGSSNPFKDSVDSFQNILLRPPWRKEGRTHVNQYTPVFPRNGSCHQTYPRVLPRARNSDYPRFSTYPRVLPFPRVFPTYPTVFPGTRESDSPRDVTLPTVSTVSAEQGSRDIQPWDGGCISRGMIHSTSIQQCSSHVYRHNVREKKTPCPI